MGYTKLVTFLHKSFDISLSPYVKDLRKVKPVPLQIHFEITGLASAEKWRKIQNIVGEERF